jgi:phage gpG-like protein
MAFEWTIENETEFQNALERLAKETSDFRIPFRLIASDFYRSQRKLFTLQSAGLYNPLGGLRYNDPSPTRPGQTKRQAAEDEKERRTGHPWAPILYGETGDLRDSTLGRSHKYSIFDLARQELNIGTSVPYGKFHQSDKPRSKMPYRKFVFIDGGPADRSSDSGISGRRDRWLNIINDHVIQLVTGEVLI